jgi:hypothetical protein
MTPSGVCGVLNNAISLYFADVTLTSAFAARREGAKPSDKEAKRDPPVSRGGAVRWPPSETSGGPLRVRQSG